jgi:hypothetical protein
MRSERLDVAMLLALEASAEDTLEARGSLQRALDDRPEVARFLHVPEGGVTSVAFGPDGRLAAGYDGGYHRGGGVVVFDGDPASWRRKLERAANRNLTWEEWKEYFPDSPYRRTIRSRPWPRDLPDAERARAEAAEKATKGDEAS